MASSVAISNSMDCFLWRHLKEHVYAVPIRAIEDVAARVQAVVTPVDASMLGVLNRTPCGALPS
jgi:hypothetical protein